MSHAHLTASAPALAARPTLPLDLLGLLQRSVGALGALASLLLLERSAPEALLVASLTSALSLALLWARAYRLTGDALNPLGLSAVMLFLLFPFHGLVMGDSALAAGALGATRHADLTLAQLAALAGAEALYHGFQSRRPGRLALALARATPRLDDPTRSLRPGLVAILLIAVAARIALVKGGTGTHLALAGDGDGTALHHLLTQLSGGGFLVGLYLWGLGLRHRRAALFAPGAALILLESAWGGLFSGSRFHLFMPLLSALALYSAAIRPVRARTFFALLLLFLLVALPFATSYRSAYQAQRLELERDGLSASSVVRSLEQTGDAASPTLGVPELLGERFHGLWSLALVIRYTPERHDYTWGLLFLALPIDVLVPRLLWPDKPSSRQFALSFAADYVSRDRADSTSIAPSMFGELWANLHLLGVVLGAWLWGRVLRFAYRDLAVGGRGSMFRHACYAAALPSLVWALETQLTTSLSGLAKIFIVWTLWAWLLSRGRDRAAGGAREA